MPSAALPDLNTAYIRYRNEVIVNLKTRNYSLVIGALYSLNALLPEEYQIKISTQDFEQKTKQDILIKCNQCKNEHKFSEIKVLTILCTVITSMLSGNKNLKIWICPNCKNENKLTHSEFTQTILKEPYFLQLIPNPPQRKDGLLDRNSYHKKIEKWALTFLNELEHQMAKYRVDNWKKGDDIESTEIDTSGEHEEESGS